VITSSAAATDLGAICRAALACDVVSSQPLGAGGNSRVFRVELDDASPSRRVIVKFYRRDPGDARDRLGTEFGGLRFLWQNGVRSIPRPLAVVGDRQCAIYECLDGEVAASEPARPADIDAAIDFLSVLKQLRCAPGSDALAPASEACFSLGDVVASIEGRLHRLRGADGGDAETMRTWIDGTLGPLADRVNHWCRGAANAAGIDFDQPIGAGARTLSPSDFGFHNAIRRPDGTLAFIDFEYFGWDDPAKTIVDFLLHPGMRLDDTMKRRFAAGVCAAFPELAALPARTRIAYPLFALKWAVILLNDFLPERAGQATSAHRAAQLAKAQALVRRAAREYLDNPFLP